MKCLSQQGLGPMVLLTSGIVDERPLTRGRSSQYCSRSRERGTGGRARAGGPGTLLGPERSGEPVTAGAPLEPPRTSPRKGASDTGGYGP
jgi:hypothetical protein